MINKRVKRTEFLKNLKNSAQCFIQPLMMFYHHEAVGQCSSPLKNIAYISEEQEIRSHRNAAKITRCSFSYYTVWFLLPGLI